jgi:dTDP-4-amino-4,6-dideoxygalactose transaminase
MKRCYAKFGGSPAFATGLHVAQLNLPPLEKVEAAFRGIFERRYFANNGPLVQELDHKLAARLGAPHAVCVTNGTVALTILVHAMASEAGPGGEVIVPAFTFPATAQAICWAGLTPVVADVSVETQMLTAEIAAPLITSRTVGILGVHVWGRVCDPESLEHLARARGIKLIFDACHSIGCTHRGRPVGTFGNGEAFSLHATKVVSASEGGFVTTTDPALADRIRVIRNFHAIPGSRAEHLRMNGKMSEAQAALALLSLDELEKNIADNRARHEAYRRGLADLDGVTMVEPMAGDVSNYQYVVIRIEHGRFGLHRDHLFHMLMAENVICRRHFYPGLHRMQPFATLPQVRASSFPGTEHLCDTLLQLPTGQPISIAHVDAICDLIRDMVSDADEIAGKLKVLS